MTVIMLLLKRTGRKTRKERRRRGRIEERGEEELGMAQIRRFSIVQ